MGKIDNPLDQIEQQHKNQAPAVSLADTLNVASVLVSLVSPHAAVASALAKITAFGMDYATKRRKEASLTAFQTGLRDAVGDLATNVDEIQKRAAGPDAEDAVMAAIQAADHTARLDKARRFGEIVGNTLKQDSPRWQEASEFIRNLEQLTDADIEALKILWKVQMTAYRSVTKPPAQPVYEMSTNANDFTSTWKEVLSDKAVISRDDWDARCGRLSGFGLTSAVQPNPVQQSPDMNCFRLTGRAVRLLGLLGRNVNPGAYPTWRYHATKEAVIVKDEDEDRALGEGWADSPAKFYET